jgi:hypothetical protein
MYALCNVIGACERIARFEEAAVAGTSKPRRNSITRLIDDVVDDTKDLVDDVLDRAKDAERGSRKAVRRAVDGDRRQDRSGREIDDLKSALDDLTTKVNRMVALQAEGRRPHQ